MSLLVLHCFAQLAAKQIRYGGALICSLRAVLANRWARKKLHLRLKMEKAASTGRGHGARTLGVPLLVLRGGTRVPRGAEPGLCLQLALFFGVLFPMALRGLPWPPVPCSALRHTAKSNENQTSISRWVWGEGRGTSPLPRLSMAPPTRCTLPASESPHREMPRGV